MENSKYADVCFTKPEMAKILSERNMYKEKFFELQDILRRSEKSFSRSGFNPSSSHLTIQPSSSTFGSFSQSWFSALNTIANDLSHRFHSILDTINNENFTMDVLPNEVQFLDSNYLNDNPKEIVDSGHQMLKSDMDRKTSFASFGQM